MGIESDANHAEKAQENLTANDVDNAVIINARHTEGLAKEAPYNAILINGAVEEDPRAVIVTTLRRWQIVDYYS